MGPGEGGLARSWGEAPTAQGSEGLRLHLSSASPGARRPLTPWDSW